MTAHNPQTRTSRRRMFAVCLLAAFVVAGCKTRNGAVSSGDGQTKQRDPLVYGPTRIPPQNVPLPERGGIGTTGRDPLTSPVGKTTDRTGVGYTDDPERFRGTFVPRMNSTPGALAGNFKDEELGIRDTDPRAPLRPAGATIPAAGPGEPPAGGEVDALLAQLEKYGSKRDRRTLERREDGTYDFWASVPISGNGAVRQYQGVGATAAEAVKQVLDQVVADRK